MKPLQGLRVCMATTAHPGDDARIFFKEARSLINAGAKVTIVCKEGLRFPKDTDGVGFIGFTGGSILAGRMADARGLKRELIRGTYDVVHCHEPDALAAALSCRKTLCSKVVYDSHELWPAVAGDRVPRALCASIRMAFGRVERALVRRCDGAIGASPEISRYLASILGRERVATILNVPLSGVWPGDRPRRWGRETVICHEGRLTFKRGLKTLAEAVRLVSERHNVQFKIVGDVFGVERDWLDSFVKRYHLEEVIVRTGWLPYRDVGGALSGCHIALLALQWSKNHVAAAPNKLFNYLFYGIPFVGPKFVTMLQEVVRENQCGILVDSTSAVSYADAISRMIVDRDATFQMSERARSASHRWYRWEQVEPILLGFYQRVVSGRWQ